jgi:predicted nucleic acid-binding Zn ribbon protein
MPTESRKCLACGKNILGRSDKKFCNDYCRNSYNNQLNSDATPLVRTINNALRRNRRILEELLPPGEDMSKHPRKKLTDMGFNFSYHTHQYTTKKGSVYHFCYEYGYLPLEGDWLLVVKRVEK